MKKNIISTVIIVLLGFGMNSTTFAGETSLAAYATYWGGDEDGAGVGLKLRKKFLGFVSADARTGYVDFSNIDTSIVPLEATFMIGLPFVVEPYVGVGAGYYLVDSSVDAYDNASGYYGVLGVQLNLFVVGAFAELRQMDTENEFLDGTSANVGLMFKW